MPLPQLAAGERRALCKRRELRPGDRGMDAAAKAAIGGSDDALAADAFADTENALGNKFGMFHDVGGVTDHSRQNYLADGNLDFFPHRPLVLVADVAGL